MQSLLLHHSQKINEATRSTALQPITHPLFCHWFQGEVAAPRHLACQLFPTDVQTLILSISFFHIINLLFSPFLRWLSQRILLISDQMDGSGRTGSMLHRVAHVHTGYKHTQAHTHSIHTVPTKHTHTHRFCINLNMNSLFLGQHIPGDSRKKKKNEHEKVILPRMLLVSLYPYPITYILFMTYVL